MAFKISDRVQETTATTGTGSLALAGAVTGFQSFASGLGAASGTCWYTIGTPGVGQWEVGLGTLSSSTTLARTTILASSNAGSVVDLAAGTKAVFMDIPANVFDLLNQVEISVASAATCDIGVVYGGKIVISGTTTITSLGTTANKLRFVRFSGALTLTHNGTSLILPGAANIVTVAGDTAIFASDSSGNWRCYHYQRGARGTLGTATNDAAAAGDVGETKDASAALNSVSLTSVTDATISAGISLTPGDWEISGAAYFLAGGTTTVTYLRASVNTGTAIGGTPGEFGSLAFQNGTVPSAEYYTAVVVPPRRVSVSATTTYNLIVNAKFATSTLTAGGSIHARRLR